MLKVLLPLSLYSYLVHGACRVYLQGNVTQDKAPLLLKSSKGSQYELLEPNGAYFQWRAGEKAVIGCANAKNQLEESNDHFHSISCVRDQEFKFNGLRYLFNQINCSSDVLASIVAQNRPCAGGLGQMYDIGFEVLGIPLVKLFTSCYNIAKSSVIYTEHQILGRSIEVAQINNVRPSFKVGGLKTRVRLSSVYTQNAQRARLSELLGSEEEANKYISSSSFFAKGHLTPDGDGVLDNWAAATYFYINAAPEWQVINVGNWIRVENAARKVAANLNDTVSIYTGVYDILTLPDRRGHPVPITLADDSQVEAPKWFWKVVHHAASDSAIALVTLNNPFASRGEHLCTDVCSRHGWAHKEFQDIRKGYTYCCTVQQLREVIKFIPSKAEAANILRFN
ncbi:uncharacterized protein LOC129754736 [Uranotaenia lowii]|uniref:uncharacterized protein LOC129754736 n=1 Tax=Uranotaenia lowii TaxID=190385 RepID=UPI0024799E0D|nr:uncharacterized protein LOC129754736 [Uranotaenia lowii]